jgi:hypothetical protein
MSGTHRWDLIKRGLTRDPITPSGVRRAWPMETSRDLLAAFSDRAAKSPPATGGSAR